MGARFTVGQSIGSTRKIVAEGGPASHIGQRVHKGLHARTGALSGRGSAVRFTEGDSIKSTTHTSQTSRSAHGIGRHTGGNHPGRGGPEGSAVRFTPGVSVESTRKISRTPAPKSDIGHKGSSKFNYHRATGTMNRPHGGGHPGRMESLRGRAKHSSER